MESGTRAMNFAIVGVLLSVFAPTHARAQCEQARLAPSDPAIDDHFGFSVAMDGDTIVAGASGDDDAGSSAGAAYVFRRFGSTWVRTQKLIPSTASTQNFFGGHVAISGDMLLVAGHGDTAGAPASGSVWVYRWDGVQWIEHQQLRPSDPLPIGWFGYSVAVDGGVAAIGAIQQDWGGGAQEGSVYVFRRQGATWVEEQKLVHLDAEPYDALGRDVAVEGDLIAASAPVNGPHGAVYLFRWNGSSWFQEQKLVPTVTEPYDSLGAVALRDDLILAGADDGGDPKNGAGSVYVFRRSKGVWAQTQVLTAADGQPGDRFGASVALGDRVACVGASTSDDGGPGSGSAYLFRFASAQWVQQTKLTEPLPGPIHNFGVSCIVVGNNTVVGAYGDVDPCSSDPNCGGSAYVFSVPFCLGDIPTLSSLGVMVLAVLLVVAGSRLLRRSGIHLQGIGNALPGLRFQRGRRRM